MSVTKAEIPKPTFNSVGWAAFFTHLEDGADLSTLTQDMAYLLLQPPPERHPELAYLEQQCHERPQTTRLRILATLCGMRRVGDLAWRVSFVGGLLKDPSREVRSSRHRPSICMGLKIVKRCEAVLLVVG